jgi:phospholipid/cholesterol/gamma-HCH transport system substrate-binding protein
MPQIPESPKPARPSQPAPPLQIVRRRSRLTPRRAAAGAVVLLALACYFIFGGQLPWAASPFVLRATFTANTNLHIPSPVRIAGVNVGEVTGVSPIKGSATAGTVTMKLNATALPIYQGATVTIRSRTFLEGNFYVALTQGVPGTARLRSGATLPAADTAGPVQLDRILSSLDQPARANLQKLLQGLGTSLDDGGAAALNRTLSDSTTALRASAIVNQALLGQQPHDLSGAVTGLSRTFTALAASRTDLTGLVSSLDATMTALSERQGDLQATLAALPGALSAAGRADTGLEGTLPRLAGFATDLVPALHQLAPTIATTRPWLATLTTLVDGHHLGGLLTTLTPAVANTAATVTAATPLLTQLNHLALCVSRDLVPTGNETITDPNADADGQPLYKELLQSAVGLASSGQNFDGNGRYLRAAISGGSTLVQTKSLPVNGPLYGNAVLSPLGSRPLLPSATPTVDTSTLCDRYRAPELNRAVTGGTP